MVSGTDTCRACDALVAEDQRYCLNCGDRIAEPRVDWRGSPPEATATATPTPTQRRLILLPAPGRIAAALVLATVGTGVLLGGAASPVNSASPAPRPVIALAAPAPALTPGVVPDASSSLGADLPDDVAPVATRAAAGGPTGGSDAETEPAATPASPAAGPAPDPGGVPDPTPSPTSTPEPEGDQAAGGPPAKHVVIISLTGQTYNDAFGSASPATYLSRELPADGVLLRRYSSVARGSLANQLALLTGATPTPEQDADCPEAVEACRVPSGTPSLPGELSDGGRSWKTYVQNRGAACGPPAADAGFGFERDPFPYLRGVEAECPTADVDLSQLGQDFSFTDLAPSLAYVIPDFCHDGRDLNCPFDPATTGLQRADTFLRFVVPAITSSRAFDDDGLLVILFDGGNLPPDHEEDELPAVGALVIGRFAARGKIATRTYDHLSLLRTLAGTFGVPPPGRSARAGVRELGHDVFPREP